MNTSRLTRSLHSQGFGVAVAAAALAAATFYFATGHTVAMPGDKGIALPSANEWVASPTLSFVLSAVCTTAVLAMMMAMMRVFNVFRSQTSLFVALFAAMQIATPDCCTQLYTGSLLAVAVAVCLMLAFSVYRSPDAGRRVFLIFLILSALAATQYCYILYLPVFLVVCAQMRVLGSRTLAAALMGIVTPWILLLGYGIVNPGDLHMPHMVSVFASIDPGDSLLLVLTVAFTAFAALLAFALNMLKTIAYNARARAVNGAFSVLALATVAGMCADYRNITSYLPLLNFLAAMEISHYFSNHRGDRSFIAVYTLIAVYAAIFVCQTVI